MSDVEYICVSYNEKNDAKNLGARWDGVKKQWYISPTIAEIDKLKLRELYGSQLKPIVELVGEDRTFGGDELFIDLIPRSCWFTNVRYCVHPREWDRVRKFVYERVNYCCECCKIDTKIYNIQLEAHERWLYDTDTYTQKLVRLVALCQNCHQSTHMGLASKMGNKKDAMEHLRIVRNFTIEECEQHSNEAFKLWGERCKFTWNLDISLLENNGITLSTVVERVDRSSIVDKKCKSGNIAH